jgi:rSAM/selenodomain-associated transferase 2
MTHAAHCGLSIIVPILNEYDTIGDLLNNLSWQRQCSFEVILCDGGSTDGTLDLVRQLLPMLTYPVRIITSERGRGRQLNAGVAAARHDYFLFLHADSQFTGQDALRDGQAALAAGAAQSGGAVCAGHFRLTFRRRTRGRELFYYFLENKARLDRAGCIHGDQGFLMSRAVFLRIGPFDEACPMLEDTRFADRLHANGQWLLLPAELATSARRFEEEGEGLRQGLNAIIMALAAVGRDDFLRALPDLYAAAGTVGRQRLAPCLTGIGTFLAALPLRERRRFWPAVGSYIGSNAWQLAFAFDVRRNFRKKTGPADSRFPFLGCFDHTLDRILRSRPVGVLLGGVVWLLFKPLQLLATRRGW